jgi:hypothetical protein
MRSIEFFTKVRCRKYPAFKEIGTVLNRKSYLEQFLFILEV